MHLVDPPQEGFTYSSCTVRDLLTPPPPPSPGLPQPFFTVHSGPVLYANPITRHSTPKSTFIISTSVRVGIQWKGKIKEAFVKNEETKVLFAYIDREIKIPRCRSRDYATCKKGGGIKRYSPFCGSIFRSREFHLRQDNYIIDYYKPYVVLRVIRVIETIVGLDKFI